jgi:DNA-binding NarL/FixJ family response regulator
MLNALAVVPMFEGMTPGISPPASGGERHVLVVEDQAVAREVLAALAASVLEGAEVHVANDLEAGLAAASRTAMDVVLLDLGLPGCEGIESLLRFRQAFPRARLVVVSSNDDEDLVAEALDAGASSYLLKSEKAAVIAAVLRRVADEVAPAPYAAASPSADTSLGDEL